MDLDGLSNGEWKLPYYLEEDYLKSRVVAPRKWNSVQELDALDMVPEEPSALVSSCVKSSSKRLKLEDSESEVIRRFSWKLNK